MIVRPSPSRSSGVCSCRALSRVASGYPVSAARNQASSRHRNGLLFGQLPSYLSLPHHVTIREPEQPTTTNDESPPTLDSISLTSRLVVRRRAHQSRALAGQRRGVSSPSSPLLSTSHVVRSSHPLQRRTAAVLSPRPTPRLSH